jgi:hypothetical protein
MPDMDDPRVARVMSEMERDMEHMDENNPRHMAHMMKKMKDLMPAGSVPKEFDIAIKRLEAGEDPEKIEADMGDVLGDFMGGEEGGRARRRRRRRLHARQRIVRLLTHCQDTGPSSRQFSGARWKAW